MKEHVLTYGSEAVNQYIHEAKNLGFDVPLAVHWIHRTPSSVVLPS